MKKFLTLLLITSTFLLKAQENFELSTLRIGPFHLKMDINEADKIAGKKLLSNKGDSFESIKVNYKGEIIEMYAYSNSTERSLGNLSTKSSKFRTKSGLGVGSTRDQLINVFRDFSSFSVYPEWEDNGKRSKTISYFILEDTDANTALSFKLLNHIVVSVSVYYNRDGC